VTERLFEDRTPEAAARQLALVLAHATECELATLEHLQLRRSAAKSDLRRHAEIAAVLVYHCYDLKVTPRGLLGHACPRLEDALKQYPKRNPE
jgi:hypothetical protein